MRAERRRLLASDAAAADPLLQMVERLQALKGIGEVSAWLYAVEFFSWRQFQMGHRPRGLRSYVPARIQSLVLEAPTARVGAYSTRIEVDPRATGLA